MSSCSLATHTTWPTFCHPTCRTLPNAYSVRGSATQNVYTSLLSVMCSRLAEINTFKLRIWRQTQRQKGPAREQIQARTQEITIASFFLRISTEAISHCKADIKPVPQVHAPHI